MIKRLLAGAALGAFSLWFALRDVNLGEVAETLRRTSLTAFALFLLMHVLSLGLKAARWGILVRPIVDVPVRRLMPPLAIGFMVNFLYPGRAGEVVRAWLLSRREQVSTSAAFGTVVVERLFDGLAIVCFLAPAPFVLPRGDEVLLGRIRWAAAGMPVAYVVIFIVLILLSHHREVLAGFLARHPAVQRRPLLAGGARLLERFCEGLDVLRSWRTVGVMTLFSLLIWSVAALANLLMMRTYGLNLDWYAPVFLLVLQAVGVAVPTPGGVGPLEATQRLALVTYGVPEDTAIALALIIHAGVFVAVLVPGFWYAAREHIGFRDLTQATKGEANK